MTLGGGKCIDDEGDGGFGGAARGDASDVDPDRVILTATGDAIMPALPE